MDHINSDQSTKKADTAIKQKAIEIFIENQTTLFLRALTGFLFLFTLELRLNIPAAVNTAAGKIHV